MSTKNKKPKKVNDKLRLPKDFHWKLMQNIALDLENSVLGPYAKTDLELFKSVTRNRDIKRYLDCCEKQWGLKTQSHYVNVPSACEEENLQSIRCKRLLTMFQKFDFPESMLDKRQIALNTFLKFEEKCKKTNEDTIFSSFKKDDVSTCYDDIVTTKHLNFIRHFIRRTLGENPDLSNFLKALRHGPGASTEKRGNDSIPIEKFIPPIGVSPQARDLFAYILNTDSRWTRSITEFWLESTNSDTGTLVKGKENFDLDEILVSVTRSVITTVPKSAKTDRTINIEPTANVYMQLAIDSIIRKSLKKTWDIDINTQEKNRLLARIGSLTNKLVTIDLSGASDSISLSWLNLFPEKWAKILFCLRMIEGVMPDNTVVTFNKLSAMGNGFTFAIETLIFSAMVYAVIRENGLHWSEFKDQISIYGDDIIIPSRFYSDYSYLLHRLGFIENVDKTFTNGPIRESCGNDYYKGFRIDRPTIKAFPVHEYELFIIHNTLKIVGSDYGVDFRRSTAFLVSYIKQPFYGPFCEDTVGWLFQEFRDDSIRIKTDRNLQGLFLRLKKNIVGHPTKKCFKRLNNGRIDIENLPRRYRYFFPLIFLSRNTDTVDVDNTRFNLFDWIRVIDRSSPNIGDNAFFTKNIITVHTSKTIIPIQEWPSAN